MWLARLPYGHSNLMYIAQIALILPQKPAANLQVVVLVVVVVVVVVVGLNSPNLYTRIPLGVSQVYIVSYYKDRMAEKW